MTRTRLLPVALAALAHLSVAVDGQVLAVTIVDQDPLQRGEVTLEWQVVVP